MKIFIKKHKMNIIGIIVFISLILSFISTVHFTKKTINKSGGIKQIIINVGKDIKDIKNEIKKD